METIEGFEWDEDKRVRILKLRGIDFVDAAKVFLRWVYRYRSDRKGEVRFVAIGALEEGVLIAVIYTVRGKNLRIITVRRAWPNEQRAYLHALSVAPDEGAN
jgi:uncharacterized protein